MEFYPLGGQIPSDSEYAEKRARRRQELKLAENELLLVHSGKLDTLKRTDDLLKAFAAVPELDAKLAIIGSIPEDRRELLAPLMDADERVIYLGWKSAGELLEYLCACDLYCQPGSQSATMQNAVCCGCPVLSYPHSSYQHDYSYGNFIWAATMEEITARFRDIATGKIDLNALRKASETCARELLDYRKLAARLYR